ncbi:Uncharacterized conserved protein [Cognatiyoonia sediminum]|uniref:Uncharacterized conserved protein n=1 Tax=Cognatiyoonia sediminum TaxID=1508389 RepID=A0A1M5RIH3_9RHOB|nr:GFA family protein [Cognatiyoonia sediminum]SHH25956.1 Uncharacterized conserved protein [Cognatiyoonia sediminum]
MEKIKESCECGAVSFEISNPRKKITFCHCSQCRKSSGHYWAATNAKFEDVTFLSDDTLTWYTSSDWAKRGFCSTCGSSLLYRMNDVEGIGIAAGSLEDPTGLKPGKHIFVADKGDYYEIADDIPQIDKL